ncbi:MAG TPA: hypothetical protein VMV18_02570, partial [bacterium]|nr:hypothetical protein [bacterium]
MASAADTARAFFHPAATWTKDALRRALVEVFDRTINAGRTMETKVLSVLRGAEIPATRLELAA